MEQPTINPISQFNTPFIEYIVQLHFISQQFDSQYQNCLKYINDTNITLNDTQTELEQQNILLDEIKQKHQQIEDIVIETNNLMDQINKSFIALQIDSLKDGFIKILALFSKLLLYIQQLLHLKNKQECIYNQSYPRDDVDSVCSYDDYEWQIYDTLDSVQTLNILQINHEYEQNTNNNLNTNQSITQQLPIINNNKSLQILEETIYNHIILNPGYSVQIIKITEMSQSEMDNIKVYCNQVKLLQKIDYYSADLLEKTRSLIYQSQDTNTLLNVQGFREFSETAKQSQSVLSK